MKSIPRLLLGAVCLAMVVRFVPACGKSCESTCEDKAKSCGAPSDAANNACSQICPHLNDSQVDCLDGLSCEKLANGDVGSCQ